MKTITTLILAAALSIPLGGVANAGTVSDRLIVRNCPLAIVDGVVKHKCLTPRERYGPLKNCPQTVQRTGVLAHRCR